MVEWENGWASWSRGEFEELKDAVGTRGSEERLQVTLLLPSLLIIPVN